MNHNVISRSSFYVFLNNSCTHFVNIVIHIYKIHVLRIHYAFVYYILNNLNNFCLNDNLVTIPITRYIFLDNF